MSILDDLKPSRIYDRTEAALLELEPTDRKQVIDQLINNPKITNVSVANALTKHTTETVDANSVAGFKAKYLAGKVTL